MQQSDDSGDSENTRTVDPRSAHVGHEQRDPHDDDGEPIAKSHRSTPPASPTSRYAIREELGSGGAGHVLAALDIETRRLVALKVPRLSLTAKAPKSSDATAVPHKYAPAPASASAGEPDAERYKRAVAHFLGEASITAQLEHPAIVPIYDVGRAEDGMPYYTMRLVGSRSLHDVLIERAKDPAAAAEWTTARLVSILIQVTRALAYAHSRGVLHRDVKPANILVGEYGEVYLADWGIARIADESPVSLASPNDGPEHRVDPTSRLIGTPGYIAPEILAGAPEAVDHRSDLFAIGVVLYEVLAGKHPFRRANSAGTLAATYGDEAVKPSVIAKDCPLLLEDLCMALLHKEPSERPSSAEEVAGRLEDFLEGAKDKARRADEARVLCTKAKATLDRYRTLDAESNKLREQANAILGALEPWEGVAKKRPAWALESRAQESERQSRMALAEAIDRYTKAIGHDPSCTDAHRGLADLYWERARAAEQERRPASMAYYQALLVEHDDGHYASLLDAKAHVSIDTYPSGADVIAYRYVERDRLVTIGDKDQAIALGRTPLRHVELEAGSWLFILRADGYRDVRYPLLLERGEHHETTPDTAIDLYTDAEIGDGFVYVPGGPTIIGGDRDAHDSLPRRRMHVPGFAIAVFPVTMREYCTFLDDIATTDPTLAIKRAPRDVRHASGGAQGAGLIAMRNPITGAWEPSPSILDGEARAHLALSSLSASSSEEDDLWRVPAHLIDWFDAMAYCKWSRTRLPCEIEWGKAAHGADGRFYPWGDAFDATFCKMRDSRAFHHQVEPVGTFATDISPYGARDMAGNVRDWVADIFERSSAIDLAAEEEPLAGGDRTQSTVRCVRGGVWSADAKWARASSRSPRVHALSRGQGLGFRVAKDLAPRRR